MAVMIYRIFLWEFSVFVCHKDDDGVSLRISPYGIQPDSIVTFCSRKCFSFIIIDIFSVFFARSYPENSEEKKRIDSVAATNPKAADYPAK